MSSLIYVGIMSGTSADGIDAALVDFGEPQPRMLASHFQAFPNEIRHHLCQLFTPGPNEIDQMGVLDSTLGELYLEACECLLREGNVEPGDIKGVGLHGQTIRHRPDLTQRFTLQIGNPYPIAQQLGITVVNDFRRADMTLGGQGAPLAPLFHSALFRSQDTNRVIVNTGGIANLSYLKADGPVTGFDTGPANGLMDAWCELQQQTPYDDRGRWAQSGRVVEELLTQWLQDPYFQKAPPQKHR